MSNPISTPAAPAPDKPSVRHQGLTSAEVEISRARHGGNVLTPPEREPWWRLFLEKFDDPVIRILMIAAVIAIGVGIFHGEYFEGIGIIIAVLLATGLAFWNEFRANREFDILNQVNDEVPIQVVRDGGYTTVPIRDLVVGDVVLIDAGEEVPADGALIEAVSLQVVESALTGEPEPNQKIAHGADGAGLQATTIPHDRVLRGTKVVDGHGVFEVSNVGDATEIGRTARAAAEETGQETPLNRQLDRLSKVIGVVGLSVAVLTFAALVVRGAVTGELDLTPPQWTVASIITLGSAVAMALVWLPMVYDGLEMLGEWRGFNVRRPAWIDSDGDDEKGGSGALARWLKTIGAGALIVAVGLGLGRLLGFVPPAVADWLPATAGADFLKYFMIAVTIIVVAVPEGLAMSVTLSLAYSMRKMTASNTLVRRMHACETIGAATVICSDKTGTLTMNAMRVYEARFPALHGRPPRPDANNPAARLVSEGVSANTTAHLERDRDGTAEALGNPTEGALLLWLHEHGIDYIEDRSAFEVVYQLTFSTERKYMATFGVSPHTRQSVLYVKGAPEIVLARCTRILGENGDEPLDGRRPDIESALKDFQARGMRTLGFACREGLNQHGGFEIEQSIHDLTWLGFVAIADPVRPEVPPAVAACRTAGIKVKMVTGDNPETAREISRQIGLWEEGDAGDLHVAGSDFNTLPDESAEAAAERLKILSRARPLDKVRLVRALQARGEVVAVTGDGINDCGALNYADVGLAMGRTGKAAAKEASDIILLDDSFKTIVDAVMWGRSLYENIQRFILFQLTINVAALGVALLGPFIGVKLPLTVIQMLWVNLIMDTFAALALATEPPHADVLRRPPRHPKAFIVTPGMAAGIFGVGGLFLVLLVAMLLWVQRDGTVTDYELSAFFATFVMLQFWNLFNARCLGLTQSAFTGLWQNRSLLIIAAAIFAGTILLVQFGGHQVFRTVPLERSDWLIIVGATSAVLWLGELWRWMRRR